MKKIIVREFQKVEEELQVRNRTEALIADIVNATSEKNKKKLARALALTARTLKWTDTDLHALYGKRNDPSIRNYTAFVWWSTKINNKYDR